jgi:hypothetical protein
MIFGNSDIVPSISAVALWAAMLIALLALVYRVRKNAFVLTAPFLAAFFILAVFGWHFEQWYTILGEVHAAMLLLLAIVFLCIQSQSYGTCVIAGLLAGLALNSKTLALLGLPGVYLGFAFSYWNSGFPRRPKERFQAFLALSAAIALPTILFEIWKLGTLGLVGYVVNWHEYIDFIRQQGISTVKATLWEKFGNGLSTLENRFFLSPRKLLAVLVVVAAAAFRLRKSAIKNVLLSGLLASSILFLYWFFASNGWARYAIIPLIIFFFSVALVSIELRPAENLVFTLALVIILAGGLKKMEYPIQFADNGLYQASAARLERKQAVDLLTRQLASNGTTLVSQWWATYIDIQYCLPGLVNIHALNSSRSEAGNKTFFVANLKFVDKADRPTNNLIALRHNGEHFAGKYYVVFEK